MVGLFERLGVDGGASVLPDYRGGSVLNLPATVGALLSQRRGWHAPPLDPRFGLGAVEAQHVVLLVVDGLGWHALHRHGASLERVRALVDRYGGRLERLTSVSPATTSVATTVLVGDGSSPVETGMLGFTQRLPSLGTVGNMLFWTVADPPATSDAVEGLEGRGLRPETFLPTPSLFQRLTAGGIDVAAFLPAAIHRSPLSRLQFRGAPPAPTAGLGDALGQAAAALRTAAPSFDYVYHPDLDTVSHREGPGSAGWEHVIDLVLTDLERWLDTLEVPQGTWLLLTADHGLVSTPVARRRWLADVPELQPMLDCAIGGEPRHVYLYARPGAGGELLAAARERLGEDFLVFDGGEALEGGLYGDPSRRHAEARQRIGDVVMLSRSDATFWAEPPSGELLGMHGALLADEMHVPLVALPLG